MAAWCYLCSFSWIILIVSSLPSENSLSMPSFPVYTTSHALLSVKQALNPARKWLVVPIMLIPMLYPLACFFPNSYYYSSLGSQLGKAVDDFYSLVAYRTLPGTSRRRMFGIYFPFRAMYCAKVWISVFNHNLLQMGASILRAERLT